jgi:glutathione S-transferase
VLPKFKNFITSSPEEAAAKEAELEACLRGLDAHLAANGPYIGGEAPCATDLAVMPRLYHMQVATKHFRVGGCKARAVVEMKTHIVAHLSCYNWSTAN